MRITDKGVFCLYDYVTSVIRKLRLKKHIENKDYTALEWGLMDFNDKVMETLYTMSR